jgi:hypothetical protein
MSDISRRADAHAVAGAPAQLAATFAAALEHRRAGRVNDAFALHRHVFDADPLRVDALHMTGEIAPRAGRPDFAQPITFGNLTRSVRVNHRVMRAWAEILKATPGSRLVLNSLNFRSPALQRELADRFKSPEVEEERLVMGYDTPPWDVLRSLDISLVAFRTIRAQLCLRASVWACHSSRSPVSRRSDVSARAS